MLNEVIRYFPQELAKEINSLNVSDKIKEIRIRAYKRVIVIFHNTEVILNYVPKIDDLLNILVNISKNSIYAIQNDINSGFVVIQGGHRIGVCGEVVISDGKIKNIKNINSMNVRIANEIIGAATKILPYVINKNNEIRNTLIVSPPGCGKTTILRDLIRQLSNGVEKYNFTGKNIGVIDERGEIGAVYNGKASLDLGLRTDIISNCPKDIGIKMCVRSMGLDIISTDEIGSKKDIEAIKEASLSGVALIFTMHASSVYDLYKREDILKLIDERIFDCIIVLSNKGGIGTIADIKIIDKEEKINACI